MFFLFVFRLNQLEEKVPWDKFKKVLLKEAGVPRFSSDNNRICALFTDPEKPADQTVTMECFSLFDCWFGAVSKDTIQLVDSLCSKPWFHGSITKLLCTARLNMRTEGSFLIRASTTTPSATPFSLSFTTSTAKGVQHKRIARQNNMFVVMPQEGSSIQAASLEELVSKLKQQLFISEPCPMDVISGY